MSENEETKSKKQKTSPKLPGEAARAILDLAFVMDCTGSMGPYIHSATEVKHNQPKQVLYKANFFFDRTSAR
jgi:hypothetical protein